MFPAEAKKGKKGRKSSGAPAEEKGKEKEVPEPVDVLVDTVIGFLEKGTAYVRAVANQVFALLAGAVQASTIDLILTVSACLCVDHSSMYVLMTYLRCCMDLIYSNWSAAILTSSSPMRTRTSRWTVKRKTRLKKRNSRARRHRRRPRAGRAP